MSHEDQTSIGTQSEGLTNEITIGSIEIGTGDSKTNSTKGVKTKIKPAEVKTNFSVEKIVDAEVTKLRNEMLDIKESVEKSFEENKIKIVELLGIVFSVFAYIGIQIQIFSYTQNFILLSGLSFILIGAIAFLVSLTHILILTIDKRHWIVLGISVLILIIGGCLIIYGQKETDKNPDLIKLRIEINKLNDKVFEIESKKGADDRTIQSIKESVQKLKNQLEQVQVRK